MSCPPCFSPFLPDYHVEKNEAGTGEWRPAVWFYKDVRLYLIVLRQGVTDPEILFLHLHRLIRSIGRKLPVGAPWSRSGQTAADVAIVRRDVLASKGRASTPGRRVRAQREIDSGLAGQTAILNASLVDPARLRDAQNVDFKLSLRIDLCEVLSDPKARERTDFAVQNDIRDFCRSYLSRRPLPNNSKGKAQVDEALRVLQGLEAAILPIQIYFE
jgi:hypothetical protein